MAPVDRLVALDVHQPDRMVAAIAAAQQVVLTPRQLSLERCAQWAPAPLRQTDQVVLEATTNAWTLSDQLAPLVGGGADCPSPVDPADELGARAERYP